VRDPAVHEAVLREVATGLDGQGLGVGAVVASRLRGADGNVEFFVRARRGAATIAPDEIARVVADVHGAAA
jgi:predicted rRNA methylase YqxC with S4 and FtsJ domains